MTPVFIGSILPRITLKYFIYSSLRFARNILVYRQIDENKVAL